MHKRPVSHLILTLASAFLAVSALGACADDALAPTREDIDVVFWSLTTDVKATTVVVGGTQQLTTTPRNAAGRPLAGLPAVAYRSIDSTKVRVSETGLITGVAPTGGLPVIASLTVDGMTNVDTTVVVVTATRLPVKTLSLDPGPADSTLLGMNSSTPIPLKIMDSSGTTVTGMAVSYRVSDRSVALIQGASLRGISRGTVDLIATAICYGLPLSDTITYRVTYQKVVQIQFFGSTSLYSFFLGRDAMVTWTNFTANPASIEFDDPTNISGGNIPVLFPGLPQSRRFPTPGTYRWKNASGTEAGTLTVLPD